MLKKENFMKIVYEIAKGSKCVSKNVGAVIEKDGRIVSTGYNGTPKGHTNCNEYFSEGWCEEHHEWSKKYEIHAEMNAIIWAARKGVPLEGASIYVTLQPCDQCTKNIIATGIEKIYYGEEYKHNKSNEIESFVKENNIGYKQIKIEN